MSSKVVESGEFSLGEASFTYKIMPYQHPLGNFRFIVYETVNGEEHMHEGYADTLESAQGAIAEYRTVPHTHTRGS